MVRIRMQRFGRTHRPFYRINAIDQRTRRNGRVLENLGYYNPMEKDESKQLELKEDRIKDWLERGAQPSDTVRDMLGKRELLPSDMKAQWESELEIKRRRGTCKGAVKTIESIVADLEKAAEESEADLTPFINSAKKALNMAKNTVSLAKDSEAEKYLSEAQGAKSKADAAKPAPAPEPEPEAEASGEDESGEEKTEE